MRSAGRKARWGLIDALAPRRTVRARGLSFTLTCDNWITQFRLETFESKEPETLDWIDAHLQGGDVPFNVGGNVGVYALYAARRPPGTSVVVFEPEYANLHLLRDNIVANHLADQVQIYPFALSDRTGVSWLHVQDLTPGAALHTESPGVVHRTESGERVLMREGAWAMTIDEFCATSGLWPNAVKIDVDGGEGRVVAGAVKALSRTGLRSVMVEAGESGLAPKARDTLVRAGLHQVGLERRSEAGNELWTR
jgi:FkbM family methyltransferase